VLAALGAATVWGHASGWDFTSKKPDAGHPAAVNDGPRPVVRVEPAGTGAGSDLPLPGRNVRVEFGSAAEVERAGIGITPVWPTPLTEQVTAAGEVQFDSARVARLPSRAAGVTRRVFKTSGDPVRAGEIVALIDAAEVGKVKAEFQQALVQARLRERTRDDLVGAKTAASPAAIREAAAALKDAEVRVLAAAQALTNLGLPARPDDYRGLAPGEVVRRMRLLGVDAAGLDPASETANLLPIRAPFAGVVLTADVVTGEVVEAGKALFVIVDPSTVWVTLHVGPEDARRAAVGQKVFFRPDGDTREHSAPVLWVGTTADETTRTVPVRAEADNPAGALRASALGRGRLVFREVPRAAVVPHESVKLFRGRPVVFVRDPDFLKPTGPKAFHVRVVRSGGKDDRNAEILAGLAQGEIVATRGSDVLLGELMRSVGDR
jgi:cobalt-zinc-cadmium efflux system membrane fusion protein